MPQANRRTATATATATAAATTKATATASPLALALAAALAGLAAAVTVAAACGDGTSPGAADMAPSDRDRCEQSCTLLIGCGVLYEKTSCVNGCASSAPIYLACIKEAPADCNAHALCAFKQYFASFCATSGGTGPVGGGTCNGAQSCEGQCVAQNQPPSCSCTCIASMSPSKALNLLINNQCAQARCPECAPGGPGGLACLGCFAQKCGPENAQCRNN